ncbi:MAG TPA: Flp pilus assembly protein CpaB [Pseudolabrys sp.]|jgi:pilus assembly protein CpaB|nr:Flp pilus assembly protein CpaB [Pseudolabrys sp.]
MKAARVIVLTVAVAAGGVAAMLAGRSDKAPAIKAEAPKFDTVDILVAKSDIARGQTLTQADVSWQEWPATTAAGNFIRKKDRPKALENLAGMIVRTPFIAGEPIREAKLVNAKGSGFMAAILPTGMRAVSTQISPETGAGGFILPNDRVDVIMTPRGRDNGPAGGSRSSETILRNIRVLAIDQNVEEKNGQKVVVGKTATLELSPSQAETLALSQQNGTLSLALRSIADTSGDDVNQDDSNAHQNVNVVRFGVSTTTAPR